MRGPPGSLARSGLFRGPVGSRSPRGRCNENSRYHHMAVEEGRKMTRFEGAYPCKRTLGAVACLQCLLQLLVGFLCCRLSDRASPAPPSASAGRNNQSVPGRSLQQSAQEPGETPPSPNPSSRAKGRCHVAIGLFDPVEGFCRFSGSQNPCGENTMNRLSAVSPPSFMMFAIV